MHNPSSDDNRQLLIETEEEYDRVLALVATLQAKKRDRTLEESALYQLLVMLVEAYETQHYSFPASSPHEILQHILEASGTRQADLVGLIGSSGVVSEIVNGKRSISKAQAKALGEYFHVSPSLFL